MRKLLAVVVAVTALSLGLGSPANAQVDCNGVLVDLRLDDGTDVGDVTVTCPAANTLLMLFQVDPPYILLEVSGFVEDDEDCGGVEVTKRGNVKVGKFPESMMFSKQAEETSATLTFDISGFTQDDACGAGHVDVRNLAPPPPVDEAWADDGAAGTILFPERRDRRFHRYACRRRKTRWRTQIFYPTGQLHHKRGSGPRTWRGSAGNRWPVGPYSRDVRHHQRGESACRLYRRCQLHSCQCFTRLRQHHRRRRPLRYQDYSPRRRLYRDGLPVSLQYPQQLLGMGGLGKG